MGCDLLGLDLGKDSSKFIRVEKHMEKHTQLLTFVTVRNWEFLQPTANVPRGLGGEIDPLRLLKRRSSLVVADLPVSPVATKVPTDMRTGGHHPQQPPTVFEEPDSNSLLDSFGF